MTHSRAHTYRGKFQPDWGVSDLSSSQLGDGILGLGLVRKLDDAETSQCGFGHIKVEWTNPIEGSFRSTSAYMIP